jgi:hypothetical protein
MPETSILDPSVQAALVGGAAKEALAASDSRSRAWDNISEAIAVSQVVYVNSPSVMAGQGIRMLNGTPGPAPQPWGSATGPVPTA